MRFEHPFGFKPHPKVGVPNWLELSAKAVLLGKIRREVQYVFNPTTGNFIPAGIHVEWDNASEMAFLIDIKYGIVIHQDIPNIPMPLPIITGSGSRSLEYAWKVSYEGSEFRLSEMNDRTAPSVEKASSVTVTPSAYDRRADDLSRLRLHLILNGTYTEEPMQASLGGGPASVTVGIPGKTTSGNESYIFDLHYLILNRPERKVNPAKMPPQRLMTCRVFFKKDIGDDLAPDQFEKLERWYHDLHEQFPKIAEAIKAGNLPITIAGYASETGSTGHNLTLSMSRIQYIERQLKQNIIRTTTLPTIIIPYGESMKVGKGESDSDKMGVVTLEKESIKHLL